jgi:hypothetical protein
MCEYFGKESDATGAGSSVVVELKMCYPLLYSRNTPK